MRARISLNPESRNAEDARYWATFSDIALAMLLVFMLFILAQFLHYQRIFVLEEIASRKGEVAEWLSDVVQPADSVRIEVLDDDDLQQRIRVVGALVFRPCSEELTPRGRDLLITLGAVLSEHEHYFSSVEVEGHADRQDRKSVV